MSTPTTGTLFLGHTGIQSHPIPVSLSRGGGAASGGITHHTWKSAPPRATCLIVSRREVQASNNLHVSTQLLSSAFSHAPSTPTHKCHSFTTPFTSEVKGVLQKLISGAGNVLHLEECLSSAYSGSSGLNSTGHGGTYLKIQHSKGGHRRIRSPRSSLVG